MVSKSALEQAEMLATADRLAENQAKKEQSAEVRRGFFMLLFAIVWGIIKLIFDVYKSLRNDETLRYKKQIMYIKKEKKYGK